MSGFRISTRNCAGWSTLDATREFIANFKDALEATYGPEALEVIWSQDRRCVSVFTIRDDDNVQVGEIKWTANRTLTLTNTGKSITRNNLTDIGSSNKDGANTVGQFGEGIKSALAPLMRNGSEVTFVGSELGAIRFSSVVNPDDPSDRLIVDHHNESILDLPLVVWESTVSTVFTMVTITGLDYNHVCWDWFLFLRPKVELQWFPVSDARNNKCRVLTSSSLRGHVFVNGVLVCVRPDLVVGLDFHSTAITMFRDRTSLKETSAELLLAAIRGIHQFSPRFIMFIFTELNKVDVSSTFIDFAAKCKSIHMRQALFRFGLSPDSKRRNSALYYTCTQQRMTFDQQRLLGIHTASVLRRVQHHLFNLLWTIQVQPLTAHYKSIIERLRAFPVEPLTKTEDKRKNKLAQFLAGLLGTVAQVQGSSVCVVDSSLVPNLNRLSVYDRFPCIWRAEAKELIIDRKLFNRGNVHLRIKEDIRRQQIIDRGVLEPCTNTGCACLESTVMEHLREQMYILLPSAACSRFMLNWRREGLVDLNEPTAEAADALLQMAVDDYDDDGWSDSTTEDEESVPVLDPSVPVLDPSVPVLDSDLPRVKTEHSPEPQCRLGDLIKQRLEAIDQGRESTEQLKTDMQCLGVEGWVRMVGLFTMLLSDGQLVGQKRVKTEVVVLD